MITVVLVVHVLIAAAMVGVILIQRSEGGALSGLGGGTMGGLMSARGTANLLTRATAILAGCFFATSLLLAIGDPGRPRAARGFHPRHHPRADAGRDPGSRRGGASSRLGAGRAGGADRAVAAPRRVSIGPPPPASRSRGRRRRLPRTLDR
jgi:preprotein translocase subunit SecG